MQEQSIFIEALEKEDPAERAAFLDRACAGDPALRQRLERLLQRHQQADSFLESPAVAMAATVDEPATDHPGTVIGPYKLLQPIGGGGMGTVFMAEQTEPVRRMVALKVIKAGMDSRQVLARFGAERQALALMDHPNIAKVFDAGTTDSGAPYFVMELVKGVPITRFCDERRMRPRERIELTIPVCQAVQHAHQKGIIHRDIKPSNVLVALYDDKPVPKVIDFGVAKATGPRLTDQTLYTDFGAVVGTLEYMSPEQAKLNQLDIDTRSDIYSLGVLLYELLTGSTPLDRKRLKESAFLELLRVIREEESPPPSTRLSTTEELPSIAANRDIEPRKLSGLVRGELDWIVMKALEKDRDRRYETAGGLAADLRRFLDDEPVQARRPTGWYRFRKFARRNQVALTMAAVLSLAAAVTAGSIGWSLRAESRRKDFEMLTLRAESRRKDAEIWHLQGTAHGAVGRWDQAFADFSKAVELKPTEGLHWKNRGDAHLHLNKPNEAIADYSKAIGLKPGFVDAYWGRAHAYENIGQKKEAAADYSRLIQLRPTEDRYRRNRGDVYASDGQQPGWSEAAIADYSKAIDLKPGLVKVYWARAGVYTSRTKQWREAAADYAKVLELLPAQKYSFPDSERSMLCKEIASWDQVFARVAELRPADSDLWIGRGDSEILRSEWKLAAADYARVVALRPRGDNIFEYACLLLLTGDPEGYRRYCAGLKEPDNAFEAYGLARTLAIAPDSGADPVRIQELAQQAMGADPQEAAYLHVLGAAQYRAGQYERAIQTAERPSRASHREFFKVQNWLILALAHHRLGHAQEARRWHDQAETEIRNLTPVDLNLPVSLPEPDWAGIHVLRREAEALIGGAKKQPEGEVPKK